MANKNFDIRFKETLNEALNHNNERSFQLYSSWIRALRQQYPNVVFHGDKEIGSATVNDKGVGEWDGAVGCIYNAQPIKASVAPVTEAAEGQPAQSGAPVEGDDAAAWQKSLSPDANPTDFDAASNPNHAISTQNIEVAKTWVAKIEEFKKFINGLEPDSLHSQMNKMDRDGSVFRGIIKSESKKIIKIAEALGSFNEILRSYIIGSEKKTRDLNSQTSKTE